MYWALLRKFIAHFFHFMVSLINPLPWDDIHLFSQNNKTWLAWWHVVPTRRYHMPHNSSEYGFIARYIFWPRNISSWLYQLATKIMPFDTIRLFCGATRKTVFMQINLQLWNTYKPTFVKLWLRYRPICVKKWSKITSKELLLATLLVEVI